MCPGLTSPGAVLDESLANETVVAIMAEGKEHAMAVGILKMSGSDIKKINKGNAIDNIHCLGDGYDLAQCPYHTPVSGSMHSKQSKYE